MLTTTSFAGAWKCYPDEMGHRGPLSVLCYALLCLFQSNKKRFFRLGHPEKLRQVVWRKKELYVQCNVHIDRLFNPTFPPILWPESRSSAARIFLWSHFARIQKIWHGCRERERERRIFSSPHYAPPPSAVQRIPTRYEMIRI